jgi:hypothetical protein
MTDSGDAVSSETGGVTGVDACGETGKGISRRAVLRGGASAAVPIILTLNSGTALAISSHYVSASRTGEPVEDRFVCMDTKGQLGPSYYYGDGTDAWAIQKDQLYVQASALNGVDRANPRRISKAIEDAPKVKGGQLCRDGRAYIPVDARGGPMFDVAGNPVTRTVSVPKGALLSAGAYHSLDASGKLDTYLL